MLYVLSNYNDPFWNLACEEYLLKNKNEDVFMLWRSKPCVIVGKHQNTYAEINYRFTRENNIKIARRLTGGGTVVHDMQNINFTFIKNGAEGKLVDFNKFISPIIEYLNTLGVAADIGGKNDICINGLKISGNAEHVFRRRVLHHGTLLFDSDIIRLKETLNVKKGIYTDKAVQSNRSEVTNIRTHLKEQMSIEEFIEGLSKFILKNNSGSTEYSFTDKEILNIEKLSSDKYSKEEWIFGYSPKYNLTREFIFSNKKWQIDIHVVKGEITSAVVFINDEEQKEVAIDLTGIKHLHRNIFKIFKHTQLLLSDSELEELPYYFF